MLVSLHIVPETRSRDVRKGNAFEPASREKHAERCLSITMFTRVFTQPRDAGQSYVFNEIELLGATPLSDGVVGPSPKDHCLVRQNSSTTRARTPRPEQLNPTLVFANLAFRACIEVLLGDVLDHQN